MTDDLSIESSSNKLMRPDATGTIFPTDGIALLGGQLENASVTADNHSTLMEGSQGHLNGASLDSGQRFANFLTSSSANGTMQHPSHASSLQSKQIASLVFRSEDRLDKWQHMKQIRDRERRDIEQRQERAEIVSNFKRLVLQTEKIEFHRAYSEQYLNHEYNVRRKHAEVVHERHRLKDNLHKRLTIKRDEQLKEAKLMRKMIEDSAAFSRQQEEDEIRQLRLARERSGLFKPAHKTTLDANSSTMIPIPEILNARLKSARNASAFENAKNEIRLYYENELSDRISRYTEAKERAVQQVVDPDKRVPLSPIMGSKYFKDPPRSASHPRGLFDDSFNFSEYIPSSSASSPMLHPIPYNDTRPVTQSDGSPSMKLFSSSAMGGSRPTTADVALREYFVNRTAQQEAFDMENLSLHSSESITK